VPSCKSTAGPRDPPRATEPAHLATAQHVVGVLLASVRPDPAAEIIARRIDDQD
jgi:hypothetical protein